MNNLLFHQKYSPSLTLNEAIHNDEYSIAEEPLSNTWLRYVQTDKVSTRTTVDSIPIEYGVHHESNQFREYLHLPSQPTSNQSTSYHRLETINQTLSSSNPKPTLSVRDYVAQLQLIRTLRPPPSKGFQTAEATATTSSIPPPYQSDQDSFLRGNLKLTNRPRAAFLSIPNISTPWDVYHNISPADPRGHFLVLPTIENESNHRGQTLLQQDCQDLVRLVSTIYPIGSLWAIYNSVGAGASQNHIHCHMWPSPSSPSAPHNYAITQITEMMDFLDLYREEDGVQVTWLKYPCMTLLISSRIRYVKDLGNVIYTILESLGDAPFNLALVNRKTNDDDDDEHDKHEEGKVEELFYSDIEKQDLDQKLSDIDSKEEDDSMEVDVYIFIRSKERSSEIPSLKLGASEMLGVFHAQSQDELNHLIHIDDEDISIMEKALKDVSYEREWELWDKIKDKLLSLQSSIIQRN